MCNRDRYRDTVPNAESLLYGYWQDRQVHKVSSPTAEGKDFNRRHPDG